MLISWNDFSWLTYMYLKNWGVSWEAPCWWEACPPTKSGPDHHAETKVWLISGQIIQWCVTGFSEIPDAAAVLAAECFREWQIQCTQPPTQLQQQTLQRINTHSRLRVIVAHTRPQPETINYNKWCHRLGLQPAIWTYYRPPTRCHLSLWLSC